MNTSLIPSPGAVQAHAAEIRNAPEGGEARARLIRQAREPQSSARWYTALNTDHDSYGDVSHTMRRETLVRLLLNEEIDPAQIVTLHIADRRVEDVSAEIAEEVMQLWIEKSDEETIEFGKPPKFCRIHGTGTDSMREDALESIASERSHVREVSSPSLMGR